MEELLPLATRLGETVTAEELHLAAHGDPNEPIRIIGVVGDEVDRPRNDGTLGSALYSIPLRLSRAPSSQWAHVFLEVWDHPPQYTSMHRAGIRFGGGRHHRLGRHDDGGTGTTQMVIRHYHKYVPNLTRRDGDALARTVDKRLTAPG